MISGTIIFKRLVAHVKLIIKRKKHFKLESKIFRNLRFEHMKILRIIEQSTEYFALQSDFCNKTHGIQFYRFQ